jgi:hypothetical protein
MIDQKQLKDFLVRHCYLFPIKQCFCQTELAEGGPQVAMDTYGHHVYGVYAWAEHVAAEIAKLEQ